MVKWSSSKESKRAGYIFPNEICFLALSIACVHCKATLSPQEVWGVGCVSVAVNNLVQGLIPECTCMQNVLTGWSIISCLMYPWVSKGNFYHFYLISDCRLFYNNYVLDCQSWQ